MAQTIVEHHFEQGKIQGIEQGIEQGKAQGIEQGKAQGIEQVLAKSKVSNKAKFRRNRLIFSKCCDSDSIPFPNQLPAIFP